MWKHTRYPLLISHPRTNIYENKRHLFLIMITKRVGMRSEIDIFYISRNIKTVSDFAWKSELDFIVQF